MVALLAHPSVLLPQVHYMLQRGSAAQLRICPITGALPALTRAEGPRAAPPPPFELHFEYCMHQHHWQVPAGGIHLKTRLLQSAELQQPALGDNTRARSHCMGRPCGC